MSDALSEPEAADEISDAPLGEMVADKGYHSNTVLTACAEHGIRSYISEPNRGRRNWKNKAEAQAATYANRRRIRRERGKMLQRTRGEKIERSFAHCYDTGGMRRLHLRGHTNIMKRLLVHVAGFNLGLLMRELVGMGKPRVLQGGPSGLFGLIWPVLRPLKGLLFTGALFSRRIEKIVAICMPRSDLPLSNRNISIAHLRAPFTTGC